LADRWRTRKKVNFSDTSPKVDGRQVLLRNFDANFARDPRLFVIGEDVGRLGLEWYYTGQQRLEANPYRQASRPYMLFGALVEKRFGHARLFVNGENLGNVKQTNWDPLLRPTRGIDGRGTVDAWAPLDGRNINGGVRVPF